MKIPILIVLFFMVVWLSAVSKKEQQAKMRMPSVVDSRIDPSKKAQKSRIEFLKKLVSTGTIKDVEWGESIATMQARPSKWSTIDFDDRSSYCEVILSYVHIKTNGKVTSLKLINSINKKNISNYTFNKGLVLE